MSFRPALLVALFLAFSYGMAWGQGPDTTYVRIYNMIQDADSLRERGQATEAVQRYHEAQKELLRFQDMHPAWHQDIVQYRLNYLSSKIEKLVETVGETNLPPALRPAEEKTVQPTPEQQLQQLQEEIGRLNAKNALLQEKLREAWTAQPTVSDPRELAKAMARIKDLEKERDLLRVTLDQHKPEPPASAPPDTAALEHERQLVATLKGQLTQEKERSSALQAENETLRLQLTDAQKMKTVAPVSDSDLAQKLAAASATLESLSETNVALRTRVVFLETQLEEMGREKSQGGSPERVAQLEEELRLVKTDLKGLHKERDNLEKKLAAANRRLERRKEGEEVDELERQLQEVESRLAVLEAEAVPLTPEEAALVNPGANIEVAVVRKPADPATAKRVQQLPAGAGPLIAQAQRAIDQGRFQEAEERLMEVLRQDEKNVFVLANLAAVELKLRRFTEAEAYLTKALSAEPNDPASLYLFGVLKYEQKNYDAALDPLSKAAQLNPDNADTQFYLGVTLFHQGNRKPAEAALRKAIQLRPDWSNPHYELAVVYATQKPPFKELARWHYDKAIQSGAARNFDLEKMLENDESKPPAP